MIGDGEYTLQMKRRNPYSEMFELPRPDRS